MKTALITGVTGQDGAYLARLLLSKGYKVHGIKRRSSSLNSSRIDDIYQDPHLEGRNFFLHYGDVTDGSAIFRMIGEIQPDEIYNLAAQSHVKVSFELPEYTAMVDGIGTLNVLEGIRAHQACQTTKFYQASTSELFGKVFETPQNEKTPFYPRSPYAAAKIYSYWITTNYREAYDIFACNGILFNHESPLRGETFVTQKIATGVARIKLGLDKCLFLGNLDAKRDWGHARDYVEGMWRILQHSVAEDFVLATGKTTSVRTFVELAFSCIGIEIEWANKGLRETGIDKKSGLVVVRIDERYFRPTEVDLLLGDASKARDLLGWTNKVTLEELAEEMVTAALSRLS